MTHRPCLTIFDARAAALIVAALVPESAYSAGVAANPAPDTEVAALRAELARLQARLDRLESGLVDAPNAQGVETPASARLEPGEPEAAASTSAALSGRLHYDLYAHDTDQRPAAGGSEFRRARVSLDGATAGWGYRLQVELSGDEVDLRDVYLERAVDHSTLTIGQFKPFRSIDELTSSNDLSVMERGFTTGSGLFTDRQWQQGIGMLRPLSAGSLGISVFSLREDNSVRNEGWGASIRSTWAPLLDDEGLIHIGLWGSLEKGGQNTPSVAIRAAYGGRRGSAVTMFESLAGAGFEQRSAGLEFAGRRGAFHWQSEWARASLAGQVDDGQLEAAYLQAGLVFGGGFRTYDSGVGVFDDMRLSGGSGWEAVARFDRMRLRNNAQILVRRQTLGINRYLNDDLRLMLNWVRGEDLATDDEAGQLALRLQYRF